MAAPVINPQDVANVIFAARQGLAKLSGIDLVNCSTSIASLEASLTAIAQEQQATAKAQQDAAVQKVLDDAKAATDAAAAAKG